jgi:hypothetical protein
MAPQARAQQLHAAIVRSILEHPHYPKNDSDIAPVRHVERPRHRNLADDLRPLLDWRKLVAPTSELRPSWCAANDNNEDNDLASLTHAGNPPNAECEWEMRPTIGEIERALEEGGAPAVQKLWKKDEPGTPYGAKQESQTQRDLAIFALKYALAYFNEPIDPVQLPDEHWRHSTQPFPENAKKRAAREFLDTMGVGRNVSFAEARAKWNLPPIANDNEPAFPHLPKDPRAIFYTGRVRSNPDAQRGGEFNDGISAHQMAIQEEAHIRGKVSKRAVKALDVAIDAHNFSEVGSAFGYRNEKYAERKGKQIVLDACAELRAVLAERRREMSLFAE